MPTLDDDCEPLDPVERWHAVYGPYHIGLCDPGRSEIALVFDTRWIPTLEPADELWGQLERVLEQHDGVVRRCGSYASPDHVPDHMHAALVEELAAIRAFDFPEEDALYVAVVELPSSSVANVGRALRNFPSYVGLANVSWPSELRSLLQIVLAGA